MDSIGHDIIDLSMIDPEKTANPRFISKILSASEYSLLKSTNLTVERFVWLLWSIKESVYKFQKRSLPQLSFSPVKISVLDLQHGNPSEALDFQEPCLEKMGLEGWHVKSLVYSGRQALQAWSFISGAFILTFVLRGNNSKKVSWGYKWIEDTEHEQQSSLLDNFALNRFKSMYPSADNGSIERDPTGFPVLITNAGRCRVPISFSHHHHYISYCFLGGISSGVDDPKRTAHSQFAVDFF